MQLPVSTGQCASLLHNICVSLFPGDHKGIKPWLLKVPLSDPLSTNCIVSACPAGGGMGSPCGNNPWGGMTASQEKLDYLGMVSSLSCSPTYLRICLTLSPDMKLRCNMSPHPSSLSLQSSGMALPPWKLISMLRPCLFLLEHPCSLAALE